MSRGKQIIRINNAIKTWKSKDISRVILRNINLNLYLGESLAITGPSGAGKSTLLHILGFLTPLDEGTIWFDGKSFSSKKDERDHNLRANIGFIFQDAKLISGLNILENVCVPLTHRGIWPADQKKIAKKVLSQVGLTDLLHHMPNQVSGGELMRVAIARAIIQQPKIILADEPTGTLDSKNGEMVADLLLGMVNPERAVVFVTHNEAFAKKADHVIYMKDGSLDYS